MKSNQMSIFYGSQIILSQDEVNQDRCPSALLQGEDDDGLNMWMMEPATHPNQRQTKSQTHVCPAFSKVRNSNLRRQVKAFK